jgi:transcriptional regulator with XRE-family HTH domain
MEFAAEMRRLMEARGISGCELARMIYCDKALISRLKNGRQAPSAKRASEIDTALEAGGKLVAIARAEAGPGRRSVLAGGLLAGGLLAIGPDARELLTWSERHPAQIDAAGVGALADLLTAQRRADDVMGSRVILRPVLSQLGVIEGLVRQARGPVRQKLLDIAQQWGQFGGWLCRNTADFPEAAVHIGHSLEWAEELGDRTMTATVLMTKSEMAAYSGEAGAAVGLAQAAQADTRAATGQRALAAIYEARGHGLAGDSAAAERALGSAQVLAAALASRPQDQRPWSYWMTPGFFRNEEGITCAFLAADPRWHARAVSLLTTADDGRPRVWASAQNRTYLAFAHTQAGEVDQACAAAMQASGPVRRAGSVKTTLVLARVRAELQARYPADPQVAEMASALA